MQCDTVIGRVVGADSLGLYVKLYNVRLIENRPITIPTEDEGFTLVSECQEIPNHLKRKADYGNEVCELASKYIKPNDDEPIVLMRVLVQSDTSELLDSQLRLPDFDFNDNFSDVDEIDTTNVDIDDIFPFMTENSALVNVNTSAQSTSGPISSESENDDGPTLMILEGNIVNGFEDGEINTPPGI